MAYSSPMNYLKKRFDISDAHNPQFEGMTGALEDLVAHAASVTEIRSPVKMVPVHF